MDAKSFMIGVVAGCFLSMVIRMMVVLTARRL